MRRAGGNQGIGWGARHALAPLPLQTYQRPKQNGREQMSGKVQGCAAHLNASMDIELEHPGKIVGSTPLDLILPNICHCEPRIVAADC